MAQIRIFLMGVAAGCSIATHAPPPETRNTTGPGFTSYCIGNKCPGNGHDKSTSPGVVLMGGSDAIDAAFQWQISHANAGNFLGELKALLFTFPDLLFASDALLCWRGRLPTPTHDCHRSSHFDLQFLVRRFLTNTIHIYGTCRKETCCQLQRLC